MGLETVSLLVRVGALRFTGRSKKKLLWEANLKFSKGEGGAEVGFVCVGEPGVVASELAGRLDRGRL